MEKQRYLANNTLISFKAKSSVRVLSERVQEFKGTRGQVMEEMLFTWTLHRNPRPLNLPALAGRLFI